MGIWPGQSLDGLAPELVEALAELAMTIQAASKLQDRYDELIREVFHHEPATASDDVVASMPCLVSI
jgi:hypothetical protein